jgi:hypothetical protein
MNPIQREEPNLILNENPMFPSLVEEILQPDTNLTLLQNKQQFDNREEPFNPSFESRDILRSFSSDPNFISDELNSWVMPPLSPHPFEFSADIPQEDALASVKIFQGLAFNFEQIKEQINSAEARNVPPLKIILAHLLQQSPKTWKTIEGEEILMALMLQSFCRFFDLPILSSDIHTLVAENVQGIKLWRYRERKLGDNVYGGTPIQEMYFRRFFSNFTRDDPIYEAVNLDRAGSLIVGQIKRHFSITQCFHHRIISYDMYLYFLVFFHKFVVIGSYFQDQLFPIQSGSEGFVNWKTIKKEINNPNTLFFRFYPIYLKMIQTIGSEFYLRIIRNNFIFGTNITIPSEMGNLVYMNFDTQGNSLNFWRDEIYENWDFDYLQRNNDGEEYENLIPSNYHGGRQFLELMNPNLLNMLLHYFNIISKNYDDLRNLNFQIIISYFTPYSSIQKGTRTNYITSSLVLNFGRLMGEIQFSNSAEFVYTVVQYIFIEIENKLVRNLEHYSGMDEEDFKEFVNSTKPISILGEQIRLLDPQYPHIKNIWSNLRILGWKLVGFRSMNLYQQFDRLLQAFHQGNLIFQSWVDIFYPDHKSNCILQIIGFILYENKLISRIDISLILLSLNGLLVLNNDHSFLRKFLKFVDLGRIHKVIEMWNKISEYKFMIYIWSSNSLIFSDLMVNNEITKIIVLYKNSIGIISKTRQKEMYNYYLENDMVNIRPYYKRKKPVLEYKIFPRKNKEKKYFGEFLFNESIFDWNGLKPDIKLKIKQSDSLSNKTLISQNKKNPSEISEVSSSDDRLKYNFSAPNDSRVVLENNFRKTYWKKKKKISKMKRFFSHEKLHRKETNFEKETQDFFETDYLYGWDVETVLDSSKIYQAWCICVYHFKSSKSNYFWGKDCVLLFGKWLEDNFKTCKKNVYFYSFNGARFDNILIFTPFLSYFMGEVEFIGTPLNLKSITILKKIIFYDLRLILTRGNLNDLSYEILHEKKNDFKIMDYVYDLQKFENAKEDIVKYCIQDCRLVTLLVENLFNFLKDFLSKINNEDAKNSFDPYQPTVSLLSLKLWKCIGDWKSIIEGLTEIELFQKIKESYKGGMCLPIKKYFVKGEFGKCLYHYDINSSYPYIMRYISIPIKYLSTKKMNTNNLKKFECGNLYEIHFEFTSEVTIPYIPIRIEKHGLIYPLSNFDDKPTYVWGHILQFAKDHRHFKKIQIYSVLEFACEDIFSTYIKILWDERVKAIDSGEKSKSMWLKIFMNSLYGKFGQKQFEKINILHYSQLQEFLIEFSDNNEVPNEFIEKKKTNFVKNINIFSNDNPNEPFFSIKNYCDNTLNYVGSLIFISSFIASYARLNLISGMISVGFENIYYFDTDSIFSSIPLPKQFLGSQLGRWKCEEDNIIEAFFLAPKVYAFKTNSNSIVLHCKGIPTKLLNWGDFVDLYNKKYFIYKKVGFLSHVTNHIKLIEDMDKKVEILDNKRNYFGDNSHPLFNIKNFYENLKK